MRRSSAHVRGVALTAASILRQPLPAHWTEVAQEAPGIAATSPVIQDEGPSDTEGTTTSRATEPSMGEPEKSSGVQGIQEQFRRRPREV